MAIFMATLTVSFQYIIFYIFYLTIYSSVKAKFIIIITHDPSEIILMCWFDAQETFLIIINVKHSCAALYIFFHSCDAL